MAEATFTFRVDDDLKSRFTEAAKARDRRGAQLLRDFMRDYVSREQEEAEYDTWFRGEVEHALREAEDPDVNWIPDSQVRSEWQQQRAELLKRANGKR